MTLDLQTTIEKAWEDRTNLSPADASAEVREAVEHTIDGLDLGRLRVAEKINDDWVVHQWIKKAVLLSFRLSENAIMGQAPLQFYDKVPLSSPSTATTPSSKAATAWCRRPWPAVAPTSPATWC